ncbi:hypothetical protein CRUP_023625 [Coryphaenoides rupestris]|nr:hypothetical protein CRUP_023625 [Coryphaenoides rupestris]
MVWHGSSTKGHRQTDNYCETWRAGERAVTGLASSLQSGSLTQQAPRSCSNSYEHPWVLKLCAVALTAATSHKSTSQQP